MGLRETFPAIAHVFPPREAERADPTMNFNTFLELLNQFTYQGTTYTLPGSSQEEAGGGYSNMARQQVKASAVVFACMDARAKLFSEARFQYRQIRNGRPGDLFGNTSLKLLEQPWEGATTGDLLTRMIQHADIAGNAYIARRPSGLVPLRPDWVSIIGGVPGDSKASVWDPDAQLLGYVYEEGGPNSGGEKTRFLPGEIAHFAPIPDPEARWRGMSWLTPVVREVMADKAATDHKLQFFENGATPNLVVKMDVDDLEQYTRWVEKFKAGHEGVKGAYKTMFLGAGHDATVVGANLQQLDFKVTQGAGETRIAAAAGVPPIVVGLSEGLQAATYSNYGQARRRFADNTMRPLWRNAAGSLARIINVPADAELWYDARDITALQDDALDDANIRNTQATAIRTLLDAGFVADTAVAAVTSGDFSRLKHSGLFSVQLQPPGTIAAPNTPAVPALNGKNFNRAAELLAPLLQLTEGD